MTEDGARVLIVDDERAIRLFLRTVLQAHGYDVFEAEGGHEALGTVVQRRPEVIILDLGLPDMDGLDVLRRVREWSEVPVIILSVRDKETEKIAALDAGADDYLTKPFGAGELMARLRAALRRAKGPSGEPVYRSRELVVDMNKRQVTVGGKEVQLTPTEYELLRVLVSHAGRVITHGQLLHLVWGAGYEGQVHLLRVNISNLRHKLEPDTARPRYIGTEPGVGYRFLEEL